MLLATLALSDRRTRTGLDIQGGARIAWWTLVCAIISIVPARAQDSAPAQPSSEWEWTWDAQAFGGLNYQLRKFRDIHAWESQNWFMLHVERRAKRQTFRMQAMSSLELLTLQDIGSPQVFQTGETFAGVPLVDYQHPHDLIMGLGATWERAWRRTAIAVGADLVGEPTLGPPAFMHRDSGRDNPHAPLGHHHLDSTHITHGVVRGGVTAGPLTLEGSLFQGREPDEVRSDLDLGGLDSHAARLHYRRRGWHAQVSAGLLREPEAYELLDVTRLTASVAWSGAWRGAPVSALAAWGQNREGGSRLDAYLVEGSWRWRASEAVYMRSELVTTIILGRASRHPIGFSHPHQFSRVAALTGGYVRDVRSTRLGRFGVGGDVTGHRSARNLVLYYGSPVSFHIYIRWRAPRAPGAIHIHH